ncbi:hypothetical protein SARC_03979 [Sphaeroforma arctica JP610]|uniref:Uncharacterized protein n=1 Tax=Sphaeroforma arctica JP610 TaxID=667725 RepID=A0A0L0G6E8_9EUKA|nr:hypothetical protein SARC_03979 [Sphaeroforma arctica JP610]KNC83803.1 hypothetical protein SARC_03979 [Sphaeroforma arctica JP610]|eukprot:XP_014157705.1 hypothetical protein SARC_03979 [Sphaeroforma arctica JP610]
MTMVSDVFVSASTDISNQTSSNNISLQTIIFNGTYGGNFTSSQTSDITSKTVQVVVNSTSNEVTSAIENMLIDWFEQNLDQTQDGLTTSKNKSEVVDIVRQSVHSNIDAVFKTRVDNTLKSTNSSTQSYSFVGKVEGDCQMDQTSIIDSLSEQFATTLVQNVLDLLGVITTDKESTLNTSQENTGSFSTTMLIMLAIIAVAILAIVIIFKFKK